MTGEKHFTRLDWRPSRKRATLPRIKPYGGQREAPLAFLAAAAVSGFGKGPQARCKHCRRFAFKETGLCRWHDGGHIAKRRPFIARRLKQARAAT